MIGQVGLTEAAEAEREEAAAEAPTSRRHIWREYSAFPFSVLLRKLLGVPSCGTTVTGEAGCRAHIPPYLGQAVGPAAEQILLLLPVCRSCASASTWKESCCASSGLFGTSCVKLDESLEEARGLGSSRCICSSCTSSLLLLLLLRLALYLLTEASAAEGVLLCGADDVPERHRNFFQVLFCSEDQWPWSNTKWMEVAANACNQPQIISLSSQRREYSALTRVGYKLLPGPRSCSTHPSEAKPSQAAEPQLPPLLRIMAELPEARERPPALLLLLQPSRWLKNAEQLACTATIALQHNTYRKIYGLFLALLLRAAAVGGPNPPSFVPEEENHASFTEPCSGAPLKAEGQQNPVQSSAVVAECFISCPDCCWRCSGQLRVKPSNCVSLCCLEQSEWLCMLRSRFSHVLFLLCGAIDPPTRDHMSDNAASPEKASFEGCSAALFVADVTDAASGVINGSR